MSEKLGIENLKEAILFACELGSDISHANRDGKITLWEGLKFIPNMKELPGIIRNAGNIKQEMRDLSEEELAEIEEYINDNLNVGPEVKKWIIWSIDFIEVLVSFPLFA